MVKQPVQKVEFEPAILPERLTARAVVEQSTSSATYESRWSGEGTRFPLAAWTLGGRRLLAGAGAMLEGRNWLTDLGVVESATMAAVRTHGENRKRDHKALNIQTTWFLHLRGYENEIWICSCYDIRREELAWEFAQPAAELKVDGVGLEQIREASRLIVHAAAGQQWAMRLSAGAQPPVGVEVEILPPENDRGFVDGRSPFVVRARVTNRSGEALAGGKAILLGLDEETGVALDLEVGQSREIEIPARLKERRGIIPLAVRYSHPRATGLGFRTIWAPPVVLESDQPWLDGMYAENLRSMMHRFTFNTWREDEPRYPCYIGGVFARNLHSGLAGFGFARTLWGWTRLWLMSLRSCGYMPEAFDLLPPPVGSAAWLDADYNIGNDGLGFVMMQWGKLFLRADPSLREEMLAADLPDLERAAASLRRFLHWDGRIEDHSEPIEGIRTDKMLAGSPFAQSLCLAGALLVRRALDAALRQETAKTQPGAAMPQKISRLRDRFDQLSGRLRKGLDKACEEGYFSDLTSDQDQLHPHTYTNLTAGMVLSDPDLGEDRFTRWDVLRKTVEFNGAYHAPGRLHRVLTCPYWPPHPGLSHNAYSQIAMIVNCLALDREDQAGEYLADLVAGAHGDFRKHMTSDPNCTVLDWTDHRDHEFSRYIVPEGAVIGHDEVKINPGNGVNCSYFLYMIDRMIGITPRGDRIEIRPELAGQRTWAVHQYRTPMGLVSYRLDRDAGGIAGEMKGDISSPAEVLALLPAPAGAGPGVIARVDGKTVECELTAEADGWRISFHVPAGEHQFAVTMK